MQSGRRSAFRRVRRSPKTGIARRGSTGMPDPFLTKHGADETSISVSVQMVAGRDDFAERGSVSRSTLKATDALDLSKRWAACKAAAGHRPALLWLRLRRAVLYSTVIATTKG